MLAFQQVVHIDIGWKHTRPSNLVGVAGCVLKVAYVRTGLIRMPSAIPIEVFAHPGRP